MHNSVSDIIGTFDLRPHPEGGYFRETYRSSGTIPKEALPSDFGGVRNYSTCIYFLLPEGKSSALHRIRQDEIWHFYLGGPMTLTQISPEKKVEQFVLGQDIMKDQIVQHVVPAGFWFGGRPNPGSEFSFVGCTVAPGFDFADFEMGNRSELIRQFPHAKGIIEELT